ncbi:MAG: ferredoxin [bacterium]
MKVKIWVDRPKCATFASCTIADDPVFYLDDEGKALLDVEKVKVLPSIKSVEQHDGEQGYPEWTVECDDTKWIEDNLTAGAMRCPVFAIIITDLESGKVIFPQ